MSTINYFNLYSLDFSRVNNLRVAIGENQDKLGLEICSALNGGSTKNSCELAETVIERLSPFQEGKNEEVKKMLSNAKQALLLSQETLSNYGGACPFQIQEIVHQILGISEQAPFADQLRETYFTLMQKSGFLSTEHRSINLRIDYQPGALAAGFLKAHPEKKTMAIGCGASTKTHVTACHYRLAEDHATDPFSIDLFANLGPDVVVNMHDEAFWKAIPDERFTKIFDHTMGNFLFEDARTKNTLKELFRALSPGGSLMMEHAFQEEHKGLLREAGFTVGEGIAKEASKK